DLPPMSEDPQAAFAGEVAEPDWSDRDAVIAYLLRDAQLYAARSRPFETDAMRTLLDRAYDRTSSMASAMNHFQVAGDSDLTRDDLTRFTVPTLVLHGTEDPLLPFEHGRAGAAAIPGARLVPLERTGHELPASAWDLMITELLRHTAPTPA
ncbi:MAG TPA: alpha/beta hydrolase, partial [Microlunatus sp.]|nr:alpha/beta hydrolase [Microlunatus sp.]